MLFGIMPDYILRNAIRNILLQEYPRALTCQEIAEQINQDYTARQVYNSIYNLPPLCQGDYDVIQSGHLGEPNRYRIAL